MKQNQESNYWKPGKDEPKKPDNSETSEQPEMYAPAPVEEPTPEPKSEPKQRQKLDDEPVSWQANEYIDQEKNGLWFVIFGIIVLGLIAIDLFVFKSYTFSALVVVMAIAVIIYSRRPPRNIQYVLSGNQGLYVGDKLYHFDEFKAFGLIKDGENHSIMLLPIKRFAPGVSVYFPEEVGEEIVDILGARLPMENLKLDIIDVVVRKLRL